MSYLTNLLTSTTSRYTSLRRTLLSSSSEDDSSVEDPESSHVSRVLRAYYKEKGHPFPAWLGTDPRAAAQAQQPQQSFVGSAQSSLRGQTSSGTGNVGSAGGRGLGDLWADSPNGEKQPEEVGGLRRGFRPRLGMKGDTSSQSQKGEEINVRQLPSQRAGSYQTQGQGPPQSQQSQLPIRNVRPTPPNSASSGSVQERLKARLGNRSSGTPSPPLTGYDRIGGPSSGASEGAYDDRASTGGKTYGGGQGSSRGNDSYNWGSGWRGGGQGYEGGGGGRNETGYGTGGQRPR